jgi:hypothetical protein
MRAIYVADSEGVVAVAANSTVYVYGVKANTGHAVDLLALAFSVDQATPTASDKAVYVELCAATWATNAPGTNSTSVTVDQEAGPRIAQTFTAAKTWTASPTVINPLRPFDVDPYKFTYERDFLDVLNLDFNVGEGFVLRVTNPTGNQSVNVRAWSRWARV